ncbi:unnamed protein product [Echinostoma caproni]|uniref:MFS domain-containing protein n=1 Tax=Echinostoma caproni TaxID=27848 RepID=A0A183A9M1_9TREM|nr:unnamed protein product [Echinostoma caproni]
MPLPLVKLLSIACSNPNAYTDSNFQPCLHKRTGKIGEDATVLLRSVTSSQKRAITVCEALQVPNVVAYSILLFFAKLVSYTFLYWLPNYLAMVEGDLVNAEQAANLSVIFDLGGIVGGVLAGLLSDSRNAESDGRIIWRRSVTCSIMLLLAAPSLLMYQQLASATSSISLALLFFCGALVNGPYALITTAVAADLGTQPSLSTRTRALATITAIIDGTGSFGAALGPFLTGLLVPFGWSSVFIMLIVADLFALCVALWVTCHTRRGYIPSVPVEKDLLGI